jgi:polysaccharide biosynthesis protein PslG
MSLSRPGLRIGLAASVATMVIALAAKSAHATATPPSFFGLNVDHYWPPLVPFGAYRVWDAVGAGWNAIQATADGGFDFDGVDEDITRAQNQPAILYTFGRTAAWDAQITNCPGGGTGADRGACSPPLDVSTGDETWKAFVTALVARYKGRVKYYELWNEFNDIAFWGGSLPTSSTLPELATMVQAAYGIIKATDPNASVLSPCTTYATGYADMAAYLALPSKPGQYADAIDFHGYVGSPEEIVPLVQGYQAVVADAGLGTLPLIDTEGSWGPNISQFPTEPNAACEAGACIDPNSPAAAAFVSRWYILQWSMGVAAVYWYGWAYGDESGTLYVTDEAGAAPTGLNAAGTAYKTLYGWLVGSTSTGGRRGHRARSDRQLASSLSQARPDRGERGDRGARACQSGARACAEGRRGTGKTWRSGHRAGASQSRQDLGRFCALVRRRRPRARDRLPRVGSVLST